ncbi:MAG: oligosaccharide flippase family protein, partial [Candidatus Daviesbacteria bacterium]|nr:oligosaccharide flippase family protein [Candidatus Daviesbacteria bacterium]
MGKILGQASWLFFAQFLTRILGFFYTIFLAKNLGVLDFGLYSVALAYFSIVSAVADFGFNRYLILEVSVDKIKASTLLFSVGMLRVTITTILFAIFALGLYIIDPDKARVNLSLLAVIAVIPLSVSQTIDSIFVAFRKLEYSAISLSILTLSSCIVGIYFINQGFGSTGAILALIIGQIGFLFTQLIFAKRQN